MSLFSNKPKPFLGMVFDISTSSVGGALVNFRSGKLPHIIYTTRENVYDFKDIEPARKIDCMIRSLGIVYLRIIKEGRLHLNFTDLGDDQIKKAFCFFSIPWSESIVRMIAANSPKPFTVTEEYIKNLLDKEEHLFEENLVNMGLTHIPEKEFLVLGKDVIQIKLNGYETSAPYGKEARTLDTVFFISVASKKAIQKVEETLLRSHELREIRSFSFPIVAFSVIRDIFPEKKDFIFLDISGEFTEITVVKDGVIIESSNFPIGRNFLMRKISIALKETHESSLSLLRAYFDNHTEGTVTKKIDAVLEDAKKEWFEYFHSSLIDVSKRILLPRNMFLMVKEFIPFFIKTIKEEKINWFNVDDSSFEIEVVHHDSVKNNVTFSDIAERDAFLSIETVFVNKTINHTN